MSREKILTEYELRELSNYTYMKDNANIQRLLKQFSKQPLIKNMKCVITYTTQIFPFIDELEDSTILVWDEHFFNLFDLYVKICMSEKTENEKLDLLQNLSLLMLSHQFDTKPFLSYAFATIYDSLNNHAMMNKNLGYYDDSLQQLKMTDFPLELSYFARIFVLYHEMRHHLYKKNKDYNNEQAIKSLTEIRHQIYTTINPFNTHFYIAPPATVLIINEINYLIENNNTHAIEEFFCDLFACYDLIDLLLREYKKGIPEEVQFAFQTTSLVSNFINETMIFFKLWEKIYENRKNGNYVEAINDVFSFYEAEEDITVNEFTVNQHSRSNLLFYYLYHHYKDNGDTWKLHNIFSIDQQSLLINAQKSIVTDFHTKLLALEQSNRKTLDVLQCRAQKDKALHWY